MTNQCPNDKIRHSSYFGHFFCKKEPVVGCSHYDGQSGQQETSGCARRHPGDVFVYEDQGNGHFHPTRMKVPDKPKKMTGAQVEKAISNSKLKLDLTWDEMRNWTREP
jgi:hypothetical protein